jgi:catechol 2,3-dioxygenase-like lactoylglutathione lyase family enzyme
MRAQRRLVEEPRVKLLNLRFGTNDLAKSRAFYDATFGTLGVAPTVLPASYPLAIYKLPDGNNFSIGPAREGPATHANGGTVLFEADTEDQVRAWHAAGLANGGSCEGKPETKQHARNAFGAYLRDPDGNKLGVYYGLKI